VRSHRTRIMEIQVPAAVELLQCGMAVLLDVREHEEWQAGRAPDAIHVPLSTFDLSVVPRDAMVVAVCRSGRRSETAVALLRAAGIDARNLVGGMQAWVSHGYPVEREDGSPGLVV
jgi:rhodanese-related sulfurtransferase